MTSPASTCHVVAATNVGHTRSSNDDHAVVGQTILNGDRAAHDDVVDLPVLLAVMDGMGGHPAGDVASRLVAEHLTAVDPTDLTQPRQVQALVDDLDRRLVSHMQTHPDTTTMGTTLVAAAVHAPDAALVFAVGDSLALWSTGEQFQAVFPPDRSSWGGITQVLGGSRGADDANSLHPHVLEVVGPGRLLLSSDGLTDMLGRDELAAAMAVDDLRAAAIDLVDRALAAGGHDNVTVVIMDLAAST